MAKATATTGTTDNGAAPKAKVINVPQSVTDDITLLFKDLAAPEKQVVFKVDSRPGLPDINGGVNSAGQAITGAVDTFELRTGPTDVDSFHDFYRLQIAFQDVWTELTADPGIYKIWNRLMDTTLDAQRNLDRATKSFQFVDENGNVINAAGQQVFVGGAPLTINTIKGADDLKSFLDFLKQEFGLETGDVPPAYSALADIVRKLARMSADLFNQIDRIGGNGFFHIDLPGFPGDSLVPDSIKHFSLGGWGTGTDGGLNNGNWPDDQLGSGVNGGGTPPTAAGPFTSVLAVSENMSRVNYLGAILAGIDNVINSLQPAPSATTTSIQTMLTELDKMLQEKYSFDVFAPNSINYGLILNYRQQWSPAKYQVGDLVSTIPLAPQEIRKYTTKTVVKKSRNVKEIEDNLRAGKDELSETSRVDNEIVSRARNNSNFQQNTTGSFGNDYLFKATTALQQGQDQSIESSQTKREFHEQVSKSAQEYRNQHKTEITTDDSREDETTTYQEIRNPNDELTVTYLFYELQRRYAVSEKLNKITPVIMVANDVPAPHEIDEAWLVRHDWIIKRVILDDTFKPALEYLSASYTGTEVELQVLKLEVEHQRGVVDQVAQQITFADQNLNSATLGLQAAEKESIDDMKQQEMLNVAKSFFDPLGVVRTGSDGNADRARVDFAKDTLDRAQAKVNTLLSQLKSETTALQIAIDKYVKAAKEHFNMLDEIERLRIHVKDNIIYYMQAIWTYEPLDQRYFRLYDIDVPTFSHNSLVTPSLDERVGAKMQTAFDSSKRYMQVPDFPLPQIDDTTKKLHQVADIDTLLGFKGNYMIFPVINFNYMTWYLIKDYLLYTIDDTLPGGGTISATDPDPLAGLTVQQLQDTLSTIYANDPKSFEAHEEEFTEVMKRLLANESKDIIVPSHSLYIEALPGTHPLLEDFKLIHRAIDVKKAQAEARHMELENLRLASRLENGQNEDPDIEKKIVVEGNANVGIVDNS